MYIIKIIYLKYIKRVIHKNLTLKYIFLYFVVSFKPLNWIKENFLSIYSNEYLETEKKALDLIVQIKINKKKALFIDCGSNLAQGFDFFSKLYPTKYFDYDLF